MAPPRLLGYGGGANYIMYGNSIGHFLFPWGIQISSSSPFIKKRHQTLQNKLIRLALKMPHRMHLKADHIENLNPLPVEKQVSALALVWAASELEEAVSQHLHFCLPASYSFQGSAGAADDQNWHQGPCQSDVSRTYIIQVEDRTRQSVCIALRLYEHPMMLKRDCNISSIIKKAQKSMYFLHQPVPGADGIVLHCHHRICLLHIHHSVGQLSHQTYPLQRIIGSAEKTTRVKLPRQLDLQTSRTRKRAKKIITDPSHPDHHLFQHLPSGKRFSQMRIKTTIRLVLHSQY
ncbi:hypothetical protein NFI96_021470 [Prochilodus magdalenae]|nr:hypothetical protein NFI96_021470 [Prochilodus magdalenae]